jgi:hypothetical protein
VCYCSFVFVTACFDFQAANPGKIADQNITKYSAKVLPVSNVLKIVIFMHEPFVLPFPQRIHHQYTCQSNAFIDSVPGCTDVILFPSVQFNYDQSVYGFREYFKKYGFKYSETN